MLNQILAGHYRVIRTLGEGGCAKTYIAEDLHRPGHPQCVVKYLKPSSKDTIYLLNIRRLFQREAEILEKLGQHSQIPRLLAYFEHDQEFYLVQEFIEGFTLTRELPRGHRWTERKVILLLRDILSILEFVHSYGVIHRDIKPSNLIRRSSDGRLVLIDFGAVKQILSSTAIEETSEKYTTIAIGTQGYMPTEQARGKPRLNSDLYALGMVGIQALTGVSPLRLQEDADGEVLWQDQAQVSTELATILSQMVRYHFRDRYQSSTQVLQDLQPLIGLASYRPSPPAKIAEVIRLPETEIFLETETLETKEELKKSSVAPLLETLPVVSLPETQINLEPNILPETSIVPETVGNPLEAIKIIAETNYLPEIKIDFDGNTWEKPSDITDSELLINTEVVIPQPSNPEKKSFDTNANQYLLLPASSPEIAAEDLLKKTGTNQKKKLWLIGSVIVAALAGVSLIGNYGYTYWLAWKSLEQTRLSATATKYQECIQQAQEISPQYSSLYTEAQELLGKCLFAQAQKLATNNQWQEVNELVSQIPVNVSSYSSAKKLLGQGTEKIWQEAIKKYQQGNLEEAMVRAKIIPETSPIFSQVKTTIQKWQQEWKNNETYLKASQQALVNKQWSQAIEEAKKISDHSYWQKQTKPILEQANSEIAKNTQEKVIKANIRPKTANVRTSQPKTANVRTSRPKTANVRTSRPKIANVRTSRPKIATKHSYRKAPPRAPRASSSSIPRDNSPACSGGQC